MDYINVLSEAINCKLVLSVLLMKTAEFELTPHQQFTDHKPNLLTMTRLHNRWVGGWVAGQLAGWIDRWMGGWMDG